MALEFDDTQAAVLLELLGLAADTEDVQLILDTVRDAVRDPMLPPVDAQPSAIARLVPIEAVLSIGPGTASTSRPRSAAVRPVFKAPDRCAASTTTVAEELAAMSRLRVRKDSLRNCTHDGYSHTTAPRCMACVNKASLAGG